MAEYIYLLKVDPSVAEALGGILPGKLPSHVRLSTRAPLSNWGYAGTPAVASLIAIHQLGPVMGPDDPELDTPRMLIPWHNVAYIADGTGLANSTANRGRSPHAIRAKAR